MATKFAVYEVTVITPIMYQREAGMRDDGARGTDSGDCHIRPAKAKNKELESDISRSNFFLRSSISSSFISGVYIKTFFKYLCKSHEFYIIERMFEISIPVFILEFLYWFMCKL